MKIVVAKPLIAVDNSHQSWDNFNALRSVQPATVLLGADLPRSGPAKRRPGLQKKGAPEVDLTTGAFSF